MTSSTSASISLEHHASGVALLWLDVPDEPVNTLKREFIDEFADICDALDKDTNCQGLVIASRKPDNFVAGADISMLEEVDSVDQGIALSRDAQRCMNRLAAMRCPVVAAIDGSCLGGGLELALACDARIVSQSPKSKLGLPEVQLGILPGAGGTQRLPRLVGLEKAVDMMLTGKQINTRRAVKMGLANEAVPKAILVDVAIAWAQKLATQKADTTTVDPWRDWQHSKHSREVLLGGNPIGRSFFFNQAHKRLNTKTKGNYPAPKRILEVIRIGIERGFNEGLAAEAHAFGELLQTPESYQLTGIFRAQTALKKSRGVEDPTVDASPIHRVGILGAGLMGAGIAYVSSAKANAHVRLNDQSAKGILRGMRLVQRELDIGVKRKKLTHREADRIRTRVTASTDLRGFENSDLIIEAVFEDLKVKREVLKQVEELNNSRLIFASNTSSLPIADIAEQCAHPERVIGMHYFSPVPKMPLLEIIVTPQTAPWVVASCVAFGKQQGKTVIVVSDGPGFYTTRILAPFLNEAAYLLEEGVPIDAIDKAFVKAGFPVGPLKLTDEVGIDVGDKVCKVMQKAFGERMIAAPALQKLLDDGRLGRKNNKGFYHYDQKDTRKVDESVYDILGTRGKLKTLSHDDIVWRCLLPMLNESVRCLEEGILKNPRDGDIGAVFGLGFPPFLGGPFRFIDSQGVDVIVERSLLHQQRLGDRFAPPQHLLTMQNEQQEFYPTNDSTNTRSNNSTPKRASRATSQQSLHQRSGA